MNLKGISRRLMKFTTIIEALNLALKNLNRG